jgi:hypothetical protein
MQAVSGRGTGGQDSRFSSLWVQVQSFLSGDFCGRFLRTPAPSGGIKRLESGKIGAVALSGNKSFPAEKIVKHCVNHIQTTSNSDFAGIQKLFDLF